MADEVWPGVFVGREEDAVGFRGRVCRVLESAPPAICQDRVAWIPLLRPLPEPPHVQADPGALKAIAAYIDAALRDRVPVLVHCGAGIERSPLAVAWWLQARQGLSLDAAYAHIRAVRPVVQDRQAWLPPPSASSPG